jgi:cysteinyl-tRNA synthetase
LLGAHYRSQAAFSWEAMTSAKNSRAALVQRVAKILSPEKISAGAEPRGDETDFSEAAAAALSDFADALENDLAVPRALSVLQTSLKDQAIPDAEKIALVGRMDSVFALNLIDSARELLENAAAPQVTSDGSGDADIESLVQKRAEAKKAKDYAEADRIRGELRERGIALEDTPSGTVWKRV